MKNQKSKMNWNVIILCLVVLSISPLVFYDKPVNNSVTEINEISVPKFNIPKSQSTAYPYNGSELSNITLDLVLHDTDYIVEGVMNIDYFNNDSQTFDVIAFHTFVDGMDYDTRPGSIEIYHVYEDGNPSTPLTYETHPDDHYMWVNLSTPLAPKSRVQFEISFNTTFPDGGIDRCNEHEIPDDLQSQIFKYAWGYPIPVVFDEYDGWNLDSYNIDGEPFYADMAWYNVSLEALDDFVVAATGLNYSTEDLGAWSKYYYDPQLPVREFTFSASKYFIIQSKNYSGKTISNYYIPRVAPYWGEYMIDRTLDAFTLFTGLIGEYPYPTLNVVVEHTYYGGMEHACQVYVTSSAQTHFTEVVISHELAHQWFFHLIGNDQADAGFIDEGFACWLDAYYQELINPSWGSDFDFEYLRTYEDRTDSEHRINASAYDFPSYNSSYWYVSYTKSPLIYQKLRLIIGNTSFYDGLELMYERYKFDFIWLSGVQKAFEDVSGQDLDWFFQPWFNNGKLPYYEISDVLFIAELNELEVDIINTRSGAQEYPYSQQVPLEVLNKNAEIVYSATVWVNDANSQGLVIELPNGVIPYKVVIYNRGATLAYKENNSDDIIDEYIITIRIIPGYPIVLILVSSVALVFLITQRVKIKNQKIKR